MSGRTRGGMLAGVMKTFDAHTHAFPDDLAAHAIARLEADCPWKAIGDGTAGGLLAAMDRAGVARALVCMIATKPSQEENILAFCRRLKSERLLPLASVHPDSENPARRIEQIARAGLRGVKVHPLYQNCAVDDARMDAIYEAAAAHGLLVTVHAGRDVAFGPDDDRAAPRRIADVVRRHPKLTLLATHLGGWQAWDEVEQFLAGPALEAQNLYFELSFCLPCLPPERSRELIRRLGPGRILFGSDWPWADEGEQLAQLRALSLTAAELAAIEHGTADRILGMSGQFQNKPTRRASNGKRPPG
ncbi:MAG: amidohydrolase family protein [Planctomycetota bacterium]|nr:amidohydrolase family protein [Planctomycetota bacterium]